MKELSLNVLDITENSAKAGATLIRIEIEETAELLTLTITDNGCGMTKETLEGVVNPFYTTRKTRKVGMGIPLLKMAAEQTGGSVTITSKHESEAPEDHGTVVCATFHPNHIDFTPMGDIVATMETLIQGHPEIDFVFLHTSEHFRVELDTRELRETLGPDIPLNCYDVLQWIEQYLKEQYANHQ